MNQLGADDQHNTFSSRRGIGGCGGGGGGSSNGGSITDCDDDDGVNSDSAMTTLPIGDHHRLQQRDAQLAGTSSLQRQQHHSKMLNYMYGSDTANKDPSQQQQPHRFVTAALDATTGFPLSSSSFSSSQQQQQPPPQHYTMSGRSACAFWTIVTIMFVLALGNLALTVSIIGVLRLGRGLQHMELVPEADTIKFYGETDLDRVYKRDGRIEGFADVPVTITGDMAAVQIGLLRANGHPHSRLLLSKNGTTMHGFGALDLRSPADGALLFSTHRPHYRLSADGGQNVRAKLVSTARMTSAIGQALAVNHTRGRLVVRGTEGVRLTAASLRMIADQNVGLHSLNGSVRLEAAQGVYVDVGSLPVVGEHGVRISATTDGQQQQQHFKLCVCMPSGRLFRIAAERHRLCSEFDEATNPCV